MSVIRPDFTLIKTDPELIFRNLSKETHMPEKPDPADPSTASVAPGYKSTEFYLSAAALVIGLVLSSGLLSPEDPTQGKILQALGLAASVLAALGYTAARTSQKNAAADWAGAIALQKVKAALPPPPSEPSK